MSHLKLIKTTQEHEQAVVRLLGLMDADPLAGSPGADEIDVLALLIEQYEREQFPMDPPDPIDAIVFRMDQMGMKNRDLVPFIGAESKVSEVLNRKRSLSLNMIRKLSAGLGIPADVLIKGPCVPNQTTDIEWQSFPLAQMRKRGYFPDVQDSLQRLKEYAEEHLRIFLGSVPDGLSLQPAMLRTTANQLSNDKETDPYALWAWQVRVLQKAQLETLAGDYVPGSVTLDLMRQLARQSFAENGPKQVKDLLSQFGIHLIIEAHLPGTYLDGAVCKNHSGNPVIALTLRYDRLDNFWFTLMHELAHIALHIDATEQWIFDNMDLTRADQKEQEADAMAQEALIPKTSWQTLINPEPRDIEALAKSLFISPVVIAGRLRHESKQHQLYGKLYRDKVKMHFAE